MAMQYAGSLQGNQQRWPSRTIIDEAAEALAPVADATPFDACWAACERLADLVGAQEHVPARDDHATEKAMWLSAVRQGTADPAA